MCGGVQCVKDSGVEIMRIFLKLNYFNKRILRITILSSILPKFSKVFLLSLKMCAPIYCFAPFQENFITF